MSEPRRVATFADLAGVPDHLVGEIIGGELVVSPRPAGPHGRAETGIAHALFGPFDRRPGGDEPGGWWILVEPELHLGDEALVPDLAGWRREHLPEGPVATAFEVAPDWVCEVISPRSVGIDRVRKMDSYLRERVGHVWLVDPIARTLEVYRLVEGGWLQVGRHEGDAAVRAEPFDAVEIEMGRWWVE